MPEMRNATKYELEVAVTDASFAFPKDELPQFREQWRHGAERYLGDLIRAHMSEHLEDVDLLQLAIGAARLWAVRRSSATPLSSRIHVGTTGWK